MASPVPPDKGLLWRAITAFLVLPGTVGFLLPLLLRPDGSTFRPIGLPLLAIGSMLLLWCVRDFYVAGRGSLAPWAPPRRLVSVGPYRFTRNPMYVAVLLILAGWATAFASPDLWIYAGIVAVAFHVRVVFFEEPWLGREFRAEWPVYRERVPRWILPLRRADRKRV